jgi:hypothetical protein
MDIPADQSYLYVMPIHEELMEQLIADAYTIYPGKHIGAVVELLDIPTKQGSLYLPDTYMGGRESNSTNIGIVRYAACDYADLVDRIVIVPWLEGYTCDVHIDDKPRRYVFLGIRNIFEHQGDQLRPLRSIQLCPVDYQILCTVMHADPTKPENLLPLGEHYIVQPDDRYQTDSGILLSDPDASTCVGIILSAGPRCQLQAGTRIIFNMWGFRSVRTGITGSLGFGVIHEAAVCMQL